MNMIKQLIDSDDEGAIKLAIILLKIRRSKAEHSDVYFSVDGDHYLVFNSMNPIQVYFEGYHSHPAGYYLTNFRLHE